MVRHRPVSRRAPAITRFPRGDGRRNLGEGDPEDPGRIMGDPARQYADIAIRGDCCGTWNTWDRHIDQIAGPLRMPPRQTLHR